ncbi:hypothetical protein DBV15_09148 [Temnothorax longispinosus]|uniref:Uncharacterized protein n=1 Tax=Temnothorax longispinosus TaxID=300112 RepID=A0A4S2KBR1_9HYME|nr:hypothetical protein DBV15_09148 [Temnothorax longispinosus]
MIGEDAMRTRKPFARHLVAYQCNPAGSAAGHTGRPDTGSTDIRAMSIFPADRPPTDNELKLACGILKLTSVPL